MKLILRPKDHKAQYLNLVTGEKSMTRLGEVAYDDRANKSIAHMLVMSPQMLQLIEDLYGSLRETVRAGIRELTEQEKIFLLDAEDIITECTPMKDVA